MQIYTFTKRTMFLEITILKYLLFSKFILIYLHVSNL